MFSHKQLFLKHLAQTTNSPLALEIVKANGIHLIDSNGKRYIDLISGIGVSNTGHRPKRVINAIRKQLGKYLHTMVYGEYVQIPQVKLGKLLADYLPEGLDTSYFVNSGSEAIEGALKLAKRSTGRKKIIAMKNAYHGSTHGALSLMDNPYFSEAYQPLLPNVEFISFNKLEELSQIDQQTACVVVEPVQGEAGYLPAEKAWIQALRNKCSETGALLILDEIQSGMGRTGSMFAFEAYDIVPDILCVAKAFGAGLPLGAFISSDERMKTLSYEPILGHITTFGGHPLSCAAAYENFKLLSSSELISAVEEKEKLFKNLLGNISMIKNISGKGLMLKIGFANEDQVQAVIAYCLEHGLIIDWFLYDAAALRIAPPLTMTLKEIKHACKIITEACEKLTPPYQT